MNVSVIFLERAAADTGYRTAPLEKVIRLGEVARSIARHPLLGRVLVLKGRGLTGSCVPNLFDDMSEKLASYW